MQHKHGIERSEPDLLIEVGERLPGGRCSLASSVTARRSTLAKRRVSSNGATPSSRRTRRSDGRCIVLLGWPAPSLVSRSSSTRRWTSPSACDRGGPTGCTTGWPHLLEGRPRCAARHAVNVQAEAFPLYLTRISTTPRLCPSSGTRMSRTRDMDYLRPRGRNVPAEVRRRQQLAGDKAGEARTLVQRGARPPAVVLRAGGGRHRVRVPGPRARPPDRVLGQRHGVGRPRAGSCGRSGRAIQSRTTNSFVATRTGFSSPGAGTGLWCSSHPMSNSI